MGRVDQFNLFVDQQILINFLSIIRKDKVAGGQDRGPWISDVKIYSDLRKWNQSRPYNITHYTLHGTECPSAAAVLRNVNKQLLVQTRCRVKSSSVVTVGSSGGQFPYNSYDYPHYPPPDQSQPAAWSTETREAVLWLESIPTYLIVYFYLRNAKHSAVYKFKDVLWLQKIDVKLYYFQMIL